MTTSAASCAPPRARATRWRTVASRTASGASRSATRRCTATRASSGRSVPLSSLALDLLSFGGPLRQLFYRQAAAQPGASAWGDVLEHRRHSLAGVRHRELGPVALDRL